MILDYSKNFDKYVVAENSIYACGNPLGNGEACEYVYFVINCGNVVALGNCPWCNA